MSKKVIPFPDQTVKADHERAEFEMELAVMESMLYALSAQLAKVQGQYKALTQRPRGRS
nr:hypothetical protein [Pseudomonas sp. ALS1131]